MDLNVLALWFVAISASSLLWRSVRTGRGALGWIVVSGLTLLLALVGWFLFRDGAGFAAALFLIVFVLLPSRLSGAAGRASEQQRYGRARFLSRLAAVLHPVADWRVLPRVYRAFELAQTGQVAEAEALLQILARGQSSVAPMAAAHRLRILGRWRDLKSLGEREGLFALRTRPTLLALYLRALGELGFVDDLAKFLLAQEATIAAVGARDLALLYLFAFTGQVELTAELLSANKRSYSLETRDFWLGVAKQNAGHPEEARRAFGLLRGSKDAQIRQQAEERFTALTRANPEEPVSPQTLAIVQHFARALTDRRRSSVSRNRAKSRLTVALVVANTALYLVGSFPDFWESRDRFLKRWEFSAVPVLRGEWWRTLSYLFVHANAIHLLMNLGGLWILGPIVERAFGRVRFSIIYLVSGCAGTATYLGLALLQLSRVELVGASGCIMGLLGANAAVMLRAWLKHRAPMARQIFLRLLAVVALQVAFDYSTPQVAGLAHAIGLLAGFLSALLLRDGVDAARIAEYAR